MHCLYHKHFSIDAGYGLHSFALICEHHLSIVGYGFPKLPYPYKNGKVTSGVTFLRRLFPIQMSSNVMHCLPPSPLASTMICQR